MCDEGITLHLSESDTAGTFTTLWTSTLSESRAVQIILGSAHLDRLSCDGIDRSSCSDLELVQHHVAQTLVVDNADVDVCSELLTCDAGVHWFVAIVVVARRNELLAEVVNCSIFLREPAQCVRHSLHSDMMCTHWKGVASCARPCIAPAFPAILSTNMPMVIRLGNA